MNAIYEKLFNTYAVSALDDAGNFHEQKILSHLDSLSLTGKARAQLIDLFYDCYNGWSLDAFVLGLHLGLSLRNDDIRRLRPEQVQ